MIEALSFAYRRNPTPVLSNFTATFAPGTLTGVAGSSGAGKSTLLYLAGLMLTPLAGSVSLGGDRVDNLPDRQRSRLRARHFGFVFQDAALDPARPVLDSVLEPGLYAGRRREVLVPRARELMAALGVDVRETHRPGEISGGQAQRVALARAMMNGPAVILADEPTGNLDAVNSGIVLRFLTEAARHSGAVVIVATHERSVLEQMDSVVFVDEPRLGRSGPS